MNLIKSTPNWTSRLLSSFLALLLVPMYAAATNYSEMPKGVYSLDTTHASLIWKVSHLGLSNYTARFTDFDAQIDFVPSDIEKSVVTATINPLSIKTDYPYVEKKDFDKKLSGGKEWFNAAKFPKISFKSTELKQTSDTQGVMKGDMTLLGVTKQVEFNVTFNGAMLKQPFSKLPTLGLSATAMIKRSEFGFDTYVPNIGDQVEIIIEAEFAKKS